MRGGPTIDLTIRPVYFELLQRLGNPHQHLPPVIHVAGTNGKGSTIATLRALFEAGGYRVHAYTSPHLHRFNERIVLAGNEITDDHLEALLDEITRLNGDLPQTFFEITTALAFTAFARQPADIVLLETGLGGRLDCTNIIDRPLATIITSIGFDHQEYLGDTLALIAAEKAGIMKAHTPCIIAPQTDPAVIEIFRHAAAQLPCPLYIAGQGWQVEANDKSLLFGFSDDYTSLPLPALAGAHQIDNAGSALACLQVIAGFAFSEETLSAGLRQIKWPGRLQKLAAPLPSGWELWCDGAHNENGAQALAAQLAHWQKQDGKPLHLIFGMMQRKDAAAFLATLRPYAASITAVAIAGEPQSHTAATLAASLPEPPVFAPDLATAVRTVTAGTPPGRIVVAGSLYLVAQALDLWNKT